MDVLTDGPELVVSPVGGCFPDAIVYLQYGERLVIADIPDLLRTPIYDSVRS